MATGATFKAALVRCGFTNEQKEPVCTYGGFTTITDLASTSESDLSKLASTIKKEGIVFPTMIEKKLKAIHYWTKDNLRFQKATVSTALTNAVCNKYLALKVKHEKTAERLSKMEKSPPDAMKDPKHWRRFDGKFVEYLQKHLGEQGIPLTYLIRDLETPIPAAVYLSIENERLHTVPLVGEDYNEENALIMGLLKELLIDGPAWNHIK